jgi:hypothetical protein
MSSKRFKLSRAPTAISKPKPKPVSVPFNIELREDLEIACMDAIRGDPYGPTVATRLQRTCIDVLRAHGLAGAKVRTSSDRNGTRVSILLPSKDNTVNEVTLSIV